MVKRIEDLGSKVVATIADNAANAQRVVREAPGVGLNCISHVINLLFKDLLTIFHRQVDNVKEVEQFFRGVILFQEWKLILFEEVHKCCYLLVRTCLFQLTLGLVLCAFFF